jgi:hypothetical protein
VWLRCHQGRLIRFIDEDNVLSLLNFADMYGTELLGVAARAFILRQYALVRRRCVQRLRHVTLMDTCCLCRDMQIKATPEFEMLPPSLQESVRHKAALFGNCRFHVSCTFAWTCFPCVRLGMLCPQVEVLWKESVYSHGLVGSALVNPEERPKPGAEKAEVQEVHLDNADFSDFADSDVGSDEY